jgi:starvation-inducible DNA-binding protein
MTSKTDLLARREAPLKTPSDIEPEAVKNITGALNALLADTFALYVKTKNFHWHMSGPHFRDYHLLLDEHGDQIFAMTDDIAERVRKIGGTTVRSVGHIARLQRLADNDADYVTPVDMLSELRQDNQALVLSMRATHASVMMRATWPRRVCLRTGSTKLSAAPGSYSKVRGSRNAYCAPRSTVHHGLPCLVEYPYLSLRSESPSGYGRNRHGSSKSRSR